MGFLDWLRGARARRPLNDYVWLEQRAKFAGLAEEAVDRRDAGQSVLVVAHFAETLVHAGTALAASDLSFELRPRWQERDTEALVGEPAAVFATLASSLPVPTPERGRSSGSVAVLVAEMHVLRAANERVLRFADALPVGSSARCFVSLEDAVLRRFAGERVQGMMRALGQAGDERMENQMISRALRRSLAKLERSVIGDHGCDSAEEWLERNCRA